MSRRALNSSPVEVIVPASDGILQSLGYDVPALKERALGITLEKKSNRSLVAFPYLKKTLWIEEGDFLVLDFDSVQNNPQLSSFKNFFAEDFSTDWPLPFLIRSLFYKFDSALLLGIEGGEFYELFEEDLSELKRHGLHDPESLREVEVVRVSFGLRDLYLNELDLLKEKLKEKLLFSRFLPAGLSKIEWQLYFRL